MFKAIRTRYYGATNTRPSQIVATTDDNLRPNHRFVIKPDSCEWSRIEDAHRMAAQGLCDKMKWTGAIEGGSYARDMFWVFTSQK